MTDSRFPPRLFLHEDAEMGDSSGFFAAASSKQAFENFFAGGNWLCADDEPSDIVEMGVYELVDIKTFRLREAKK